MLRHPLKLALIVLTLLFGPAALASGVSGTAHDFRGPENGGPNTKYPALAEMAENNPCVVCHSSHSSFFSKSLFANDFGWEPNRKINLPTSGLCMSCHDGDLKTDDGVTVIDNPDLHIAQRHPRHRVEYPYPGREGHLPTYARVEEDNKGRYWAVGANGYRLPLDYDEASGMTMATCTTCHNAHDPGEDRKFLRTTHAKELCWTCHSQSARRVEK